MEKQYDFQTYPAECRDIISSENFEKNMTEQVVPYLDSLRRSHIFDRGNGQALYCEYFRLPKGARGTIFISHGFTESCDKYHEVIYYMLREKYHVVMMEHRGHGRSRKPDETDTANTPTHVDRFVDYVSDMNFIVQKVLLKRLPEPYFLFSHSMGGAIGAAYLEHCPDIFSKAVFSAPMFEINLHGLSLPMAKLIGIWNCSTGKEKAFTIGQNPFSFTPDFAGYPGTCEERFLYYYNQQLAHPEYQCAGSSNRWALESLRACDKILKPGNCRNIKIPVLLLQAEEDDFVMPGGQEKFIRRIPNGTLIRVPGAKHEIYMSHDEILTRYWGIIFDFLADYSKQ